GGAERSRDDAPIKGKNLDEQEAAIERVSDDTEEMETILTSMDAVTILASRVAEVSTGSGSIPPAAEVPTGSDVVPTAGLIFSTATVVTPYTGRKGKETMVESETPKKKKVQEQIDAQEIHTEGKKDYWKIISLGGHTAVYQFFVDMLNHFDREDLNQLWDLVKETLRIRQATSDREKKLWVKMKRLFEPDFEDQLWTHIQALMHDPVEWKLHDTCGVHHLKKEKEGLDSKLIGFESASKDLDTLFGSQRTNKNKEGKYWPKKNFAHKNVTPRADLLKTASISAAKRVNTAVPRPNVNSARPKTTQDLVIIKLIQRVKRLKRELKARTPPIKIQKVNVRGRSRVTITLSFKVVDPILGTTTRLSTAEAEYVSLSACCAQVLWMRTQLTDYGFHFHKIPIYYDLKSAIAISCNPVQHSRTKQIAIRYHFIKKHVEKGTIELYFIKMDYQLADLFTKALPADRFNYLVCRLGMRSLSPQELDRLAKS
nr:retrovirus-related Pol polyprotein from transposon TNT 1-94 [Tanacetum cinerariifolium]